MLGWALAGFGFTSEEKATLLCESAFGAKPYQYADLFAPSFLNLIPEPDFRQALDTIVEASGSCTRVAKVSEAAQEIVYDLFSAPGHRARAHFTLDAEGRFSSLRVSDVERNISIETFGDARAYLVSLRGHASSTLSVFGGKSEAANGSDRQPLGSGFKLYLLGALEAAVRAGTAKWDEKLALREEWKSFPTGTMQLEPAGTEFTLQYYATKMISISDNTATDHLLYHLGRGAVEAQLIPMGNPFPSLNLPFLGTMELFKLRWGVDPKVTQSYINASEAARRTLLATTIAATPASKVGTNGMSLIVPKHINDIEWFGSTDGQCAALEKLHERKSPEVKAVLSVNQPLVKPGQFKYVGFKGGAEPGVLTLAYLLQGNSGKWGCFSVAWHDETRGINQAILYDFVRKALKLAEKAL